MPELAFATRSYLNILAIALVVAGKRIRHQLVAAIQAALSGLVLILAVLVYITWRRAKRIDN